MKNGLFKIMLFVMALALTGCVSPETPPTEKPPAEEALDPLTKARQKLFDELGIQEENTTAKNEAPLPPVLPSPPELPKTDADWPTN